MSYPLLQERKGASLRDTWGVTDRSDVYVFSPSGELLEHILAVNNVSSPGGYTIFKDKLLVHLGDATKP